MDAVTSPDGTKIAFNRSGGGPPLVLVHAAGAANATAWTGVLPALEKHFTVCAVDRRGHGASGDASTYAIEREYEDIAAVVDSFGEPACLLGHSFGGLCSLGAALLASSLRSLILYEPLSLPLPGKPLYPIGFIPGLQAQIDSGDRESALILFYQVIAGLSQQEISRLQSTQAWAARLAIVHTLPRELDADQSYTFETQKYQNLQVPTLLLEGGESREHEKKGNAALAAAIPGSRIAVLPGQDHIAMYTAPELFARVVLDMLLPGVKSD